MKKIAFKISDDSFTLFEPNLHDGKLLSIAAPIDKRVEIKVEDVLEKQYSIILDGVTRFCASDFREGNIILDVMIMRGRQVKQADLSQLLYAGQMGEEAKVYLEHLLEDIVHKSLLVLQINPSYGCLLIGIARNIDIMLYSQM